MKNRILSITRNVIPYVKELNPIAGGVLSCIVMQQLDFWFESHPDGFYKFLEPTNHKAYKTGDSWTEELGMTVDEFRSAFDKIGIRYKSRTEFMKAKELGDIFQGKFYCSFVDRRANLTHYFRNDVLLDEALDGLIHNDRLGAVAKRQKIGCASVAVEGNVLASNTGTSVTDCFIETISVDGNSHLQELENPSTGMEIPIYRDGNPHLQESGIPIYVNGKSRAPLLQRIHTDTTTTTAGNNLSTETVGNLNVVDSPQRGCCDDSQNSQTDLIWPTCSLEEKTAITALLPALPAEQHQVLLDELEGARASGSIRKGLVPLAGALFRAMLAGTFTPGHSPAIAARRRELVNRIEQATVARSLPDISPADLARGQAVLSMISGKSNAHIQQQTGETT